MSTEQSIELARLRIIRGRIIKALYVSRPFTIADDMLLSILTDDRARATRVEVQRALQYLADKQFVATEGDDFTDRLHARLLPAGVDFQENARIIDQSITRA